MDREYIGESFLNIFEITNLNLLDQLNKTYMNMYVWNEVFLNV